MKAELSRRSDEAVKALGAEVRKEIVQKYSARHWSAEQRQELEEQMVKQRVAAELGLEGFSAWYQQRQGEESRRKRGARSIN